MLKRKNKLIGQRLKSLRISQRLNQYEFARKIGIGQSAVCLYEKGSTYPSLPTLIMITKHFRLSLDSLIKGVKL